MNIADLSTLPVAATIDLQYRLPPFQQIVMNPTIAVSLSLLAIALLLVVYLAVRAKARAKREAKLEALRTAERILLKRGGGADEVEKVKYAFAAHPGMDIAAMVMVKDRFMQELKPILAKLFDKDFADHIEKLYFPPPKDTRRHLGADTPEDLKVLVEERKTAASTQAAAAIVDLMDATLKPGVITKIAFEGVDGAYDCVVMGHDMNHINITLPANNPRLIAAIHPGMVVEGSLESGPSLMAFTADVIQAVAGSMPYCRLTAWQTAWEVRTRESVRFPITLDIDFQHIVTASTNAMKMSSIDKEIGAIRPGKLIDVSLGGCCIDTPSTSIFHIGDMIRFSRSLAVDSPPVTLLGALVNVSEIAPAQHEGCRQRLHVQFLIIDDVSQRILARIIRQLQDVMAREEWVQAQQLLQQMRRHKIENIGSPAAVGAGNTGNRPRKAGTTSAQKNTANVTRPVGGTRVPGAVTRTPGGGTKAQGETARGTTGQARKSTRSFPKLPPRDSAE